MSAPCQSRQFDRWAATSDLPPGTDIVPAGRHVSNLPKIELAGMATFGAKRTLANTPTSAKCHERNSRQLFGALYATDPGVEACYLSQ
jgi:hypothetical protein